MPSAVAITALTQAIHTLFQLACSSRSFSASALNQTRSKVKGSS